MSNTNANFEMPGILLGQEVRKRKTPQEKIAIIQQTMEPGMNVSHVARLHGIQPSLLFKWKKQYQEGSLTAVAAGEDVVPASELYCCSEAGPGASAPSGQEDDGS